MSYLKLAILWAAAACIALWAYLRLRRGKVTLLEGRFSPGLIRMVAIALVYLNGGCPEPKDTNVATAKPQAMLVPVSQPTSTPTSTPVASKIHAAQKDFPTLDTRALYEFRNRFYRAELTIRLDNAERDPTEANLSQTRDYVGYISETPLREWFTKKLERIKASQKDSLTDLCDLLDLIEESSLYDAWMVGYIWRKLLQTTGESAAPLGSDDGTLPILLERLWYQQRVLHSLMLAEAEVGNVTFVPWRSKAASPKGYSGLTIPVGLTDAAKKKFPTTDAATWDSEATLSLSVKSAPSEAVFFVGGSSQKVAGSLVLKRFSLLSVPKSATSDVLLTHPVLGELTIKPGQTLTAWNVKSFLSAKKITELEVAIEKAMKGDTKILSSLESMLPAVEDLLREALAKSPTAKGAPSLRTLLTLFDE